MTIKLKDLTLELPDTCEVEINGDKVTVKPAQTTPVITFSSFSYQYPTTVPYLHQWVPDNSPQYRPITSTCGNTTVSGNEVRYFTFPISGTFTGGTQ